MPDVDLTKFASRAWINPPGGAEGAVLASATTITISHPIHKVSGTVEITTINPPFTGFIGTITLIATAAWTFATGGNISKAFTAVANEAVDIVYDGSTWYPKMAD